MQRCLQDVIEDLGDLNEVDMKEQITIRMTKIMQQDSPFHYSTQEDSELIRHIIAGLIKWVSADLRNVWKKQANSYIVVGEQLNSDSLVQDVVGNDDIVQSWRKYNDVCQSPIIIIIKSIPGRVEEF